MRSAICANTSRRRRSLQPSARPSATTTRPRRSSRRRRTRSGCCSIWPSANGSWPTRARRRSSPSERSSRPATSGTPTAKRYKHTLRVNWDESYAKEIPAQPYWAFKTVLPLSSKVRALVLGEEEPEDADRGEPAPPVSEEEPLFRRIAEALERKNQAILYGPPGTGKTWHASGFARWWLRRRNASVPASRSAAARLAAGDGARAWLVTTKPSEWRWDELFDKGEERFRRGRLERNYDVISPGDLVFGYTATPEKRRRGARARRSARAGGWEGHLRARACRLASATVRPGTSSRRTSTSTGRSRFATGCRERCSNSLAEESERLMALISERDHEAAAAASSVETSRLGGASGRCRRRARVGDVPPVLQLRGLHRGVPADSLRGRRDARPRGRDLQDDVRTGARESRTDLPARDRRDQPRERHEGARRADHLDREGQARWSDRREVLRSPALQQGTLRDSAEPLHPRHDEHGRPQHQDDGHGAATTLRVRRADAGSRTARVRGRRAAARRSACALSTSASQRRQAAKSRSATPSS